MWVDQPVEATVEFSRGLVFPRLRAIRFRDEDVAFAGLVRVDCTSSALVYRASSGQSDYTVRFESGQQRWVLELVRDVSLRV